MIRLRFKSVNFFTVIPLLLFPVLVYNVIAWAGTEFATAEAVRAMMDVEFKRVTMASGADWVITRGAVMLTISLLLLFFEMLKSARTDHSAVMNHAFSMLVFIICLIEFLMFGAFATSVFFLIMLMSLLDIMAGFMVTISAARRDFGGSGFAD